MNKAEIIVNAILSVDQKYLDDRYEKSYIFRTLFYGEKLTPEHKNAVLQVCGKEYPGGEIAAVMDKSKKHTFEDGYLFTDEGFCSTKNNLAEGAGSPKRGIPTLKYQDIVSVEVTKRFKDNTYVRITTKDGGDYMGYASIYAPYICEVLKKIKEGLCSGETEQSPNAPVKEKTLPKIAETDDPLALGVAALQEKRVEEALEYFRLAAKNGDLEAARYIAMALGYQARTVEEFEEAIRYLQFYKKKGGPEDTDDLMRLLFGMYYDLKGGKMLKEDNLEEAETLFTKSVQMGSHDAMLRLALVLSMRDATEERLKKAQVLVEKYKTFDEDDERADELLKTILGAQKLLQAQAAMERKDVETALKVAEEAAQQGNMEGMYMTAVILGGTANTLQDVEKAIGWLDRYEQAGGKRDTTSIRNMLREDFWEEKGHQMFAERKYDEAAQFFQKAVDQGNIDAMLPLATAIIITAKTSKRAAEALFWAEKYQAATPGEMADKLVRSINGTMYVLQGQEAYHENDLHTAKVCYEKAWSYKESGGLRGMALLLYGEAESEEEYLEALSWAQRYKACADNEGADELIERIETGRLFSAGTAAIKKKHKGEAISLLRKAARRGHPESMHNLAAVLSETGKTVEEFDEAFHWANELCKYNEEYGRRAAQIVMQCMVKVINPSDRTQLLRKYSEAEKPLKEVLGSWDVREELYEAGEAKIKDGHLYEGIKLLRQSAEQGYPQAMRQLAFHLLLDAGQRADMQEAIRWLKLYEKHDPEQGPGMVANALGMAKEKYYLTPELCKDLSSETLDYLEYTYPKLIEHLRKYGYIKYKRR